MIKTITLKRSTGFTLVELLITLTIMGILLTWATADYSEVRQREKIDATAQMIQESIQFGQDYARHLSVTSALCAGTPEDQCQSTDWNSGWTLFHAANHDSSEPLEAIRYFEPKTTAGVKIEVNGLEKPGKIIINGEGFIVSKTNTTNAVVCDHNQSYHSVIEIDKAQTIQLQDHNSTQFSESCRNA
ncbi:MAG TPA: hypothetical protein DHW71_00285 [Gammaproteobacteria bacterium]|nr:hypothetical protein [Gammaproteobacteria bacterium]MEC8011670.1 prepilin-type N-terminal cleavage/methylation domain-containing protein [Pseudomonadota bacterium]HBF06960.1 hypothetical protein [Gammaproteobacteria bacterium]HCK91386.1 hypothetical protein [Gammaproteobacteria bacterium]|tara:strand:- start:931 stop:1491 length:561 start_codon:yes stop_codon:yes gene_type:complete